MPKFKKGDTIILDWKLRRKQILVNKIIKIYKLKYYILFHDNSKGWHSIDFIDNHGINIKSVKIFKILYT